MAPARSALALAAIAAALGGCARAEPPVELSGLWSAGPAACAAGVGVRFEADGIAAIYDDQRETLFESPRYRLEGAGESFRVRIRYELPRRPGGAHAAGGYGVLVLERGAGGMLHPASHNLVDGLTGSARLRIENDPALDALSLRPCGDAHPWIEALRGREAG